MDSKLLERIEVAADRHSESKGRRAAGSMFDKTCISLHRSVLLKGKSDRCLLPRLP